ncbi:hypothetical protein CATMIT_01604, partial [Catenibacterium mitsuokai DSM 15897]
RSSFLGPAGRPTGVSEESALARPYDRFASAVDAQLRIQGSDMIAHGVRRQAQARGNFLVGKAFADQTQDVALASRQLAQFGLLGSRRAASPHVRQFFDQGLAEPRRVLHHRFDRAHQFQLVAFSIAYVHQHEQIAFGAMDADGLGRHEAVQRTVVFSRDAEFEVLQAGLFGQRAAYLQRIGGEFEQARTCERLADHVFGAVARRHGKGFVGFQDRQAVCAAYQGRYRGQLEGFGEAFLALAQRNLGLSARFQVHEGEQHASFL